MPRELILVRRSLPICIALVDRGVAGRRRMRRRRQQGQRLVKRVATLETGKLKVGSDIPYPPFEFGKPPYQGFDVDVVNEIAKRLDSQGGVHQDAVRPDLPQTSRQGTVRHGGLGRHDHAGAREDGRLLVSVLPRRPVADGQEGQRRSRATTTSPARPSARSSGPRALPTPRTRRRPRRCAPTTWSTTPSTRSRPGRSRP